MQCILEAIYIDTQIWGFVFAVLFLISCFVNFELKQKPIEKEYNKIYCYHTFQNQQINRIKAIKTKLNFL